MQTRSGPVRWLLAAIAAAIFGSVGARAGEDVARAEPNSIVTCVNPASGASWQIVIDSQHGTVDSNPARIGKSMISWHDGKDGGNYTLDLDSGNLTVIVASSTGGYFLHDHCRLPGREGGGEQR